MKELLQKINELYEKAFLILTKISQKDIDPDLRWKYKVKLTEINDQIWTLSEKIERLNNLHPPTSYIQKNAPKKPLNMLI